MCLNMAVDLSHLLLPTRRKTPLTPSLAGGQGWGKAGCTLRGCLSLVPAFLQPDPLLVPSLPLPCEVLCS